MSADIATKSKSAAAKKRAPAAEHPSYKEMITEAITSLKERMGSSRYAIKKYIHANYPKLNGNVDSLINVAIKRGVEKGDFAQPKGPSGPIKLVKKTKSETEKKPVAKKAAKPAAKKAAAKKTDAAKKSTGEKKTKKTEATAKKPAAAKKASSKKTTETKKSTTKKTDTAAAKKTATKKAATKPAAKKASTTKKTAAAKKA